VVRGEHPDRHRHHGEGAALEAPREQQHEGHDEVGDDEDGAHPTPGGAGAALVEAHLRRKVADPDDEELREALVRPEDDEGEEQAAHRGLALDRALLGKQSLAREHGGGDGEDGQRGGESPGKDVDPEDGGVPRGIEGHDPVEARPSEDEAEQDEATAGNSIQRAPLALVEVSVEGEGASYEEEGEEGEGTDPDQAPRDEEGDVEPGAPMFDQVDGLHVEVFRRSGPRVELAQAEENRDDEEEEGGEGRGGDLAGAAQSTEPARACGVAGHQQEQSPRGDGEEIEPRGEIREEEAPL